MCFGVDINVFQEIEDRIDEDVVAIAHQHVACVFDIGEVSVWNGRQEGVGRLARDKLADAPAYQMDRSVDSAELFLEGAGSVRGSTLRHARDEPRIPMPAIAAVGMQSKVLGKAG